MELLAIVRNGAFAVGLLLALVGAAGLLPALWPWRRWSKAGMLIALGAQSGIGGAGLARKQRAPSAFFMPLAAMLLLAAWLFDPNAPFLAYCEPLIELGMVLALLVYAIKTREHRAFEDVFERLLERWVPGKGSGLLARVAALDIGGFRFLAGGWRHPPPTGLSYHRKNATLAVVALVLVTTLPELFVVELFSIGKPLFWHAIDVVVHGYAMFWCIAVFVSFRDRPHTFGNDELVLRRGLFETIHVPLDAIERIQEARPLERRERRRLPTNAAYLAIFESSLIELTLSRGCELECAIGRPRTVELIFFAVDEPRHALAEIRSRLPRPA